MPLNGRWVPAFALTIVLAACGSDEAQIGASAEECRSGYTCHGTGGSSIRGCDPD